jgi:hypothetical protein
MDLSSYFFSPATWLKCCAVVGPKSQGDTAFSALRPQTLPHKSSDEPRAVEKQEYFLVFRNPQVESGELGLSGGTGANVMTGGETTIVTGIEIPSTDPVFLAVVLGMHVPLRLACVAIGAIAS